MFQSTPPRGRQPSSPSGRPWCAGFNPRPRGGDNGDRARKPRPPSGFNPRPRGGDNTMCSRSSSGGRLFQSTPPRGRQRGVSVSSDSFPCFNPRPRGGDNAAARPCASRRQVSIHAPAGATTAMDEASRILSSMFQSTPPRGRQRPATRIRSGTPARFQSTPPRGRQPGLRRGQAHAVGVSIHAPAGATTGIGTRHRPATRSFNPRPRGGDNDQHRLDGAASPGFQSTPPRGRQLPCRVVEGQP